MMMIYRVNWHTGLRQPQKPSNYDLIWPAIPQTPYNIWYDIWLTHRPLTLTYTYILPPVFEWHTGLWQSHIPIYQLLLNDTPASDIDLGVDGVPPLSGLSSIDTPASDIDIDISDLFASDDKGINGVPPLSGPLTHRPLITSCECVYPKTHRPST